MMTLIRNGWLPAWTLMVILAVFATMAYVHAPVQAAPSAKEPDPDKCSLVAMAGGIEVYYCENIHLFVNQLGFMAFEP